MDVDKALAESAGQANDVEWDSGSIEEARLCGKKNGVLGCVRGVPVPLAETSSTRSFSSSASLSGCLLSQLSSCLFRFL